jgi:hypothetical protein
MLSSEDDSREMHLIPGRAPPPENTIGSSENLGEYYLMNECTLTRFASRKKTGQIPAPAAPDVNSLTPIKIR